MAASRRVFTPCAAKAPSATAMKAFSAPSEKNTRSMLSNNYVLSTKLIARNLLRDDEPTQSLGIGEEVAAWPVVDDAAAAHDERFVRHLQGELGVLLDQEHGELVLGHQALERLEQCFDDDRRQALQRLVHEEQ